MNKYWNNIMVKALIFTDEEEIASGVQEFQANQPGTIALIVIFSYHFFNISINFLFFSNILINSKIQI